jgi:bud emergence protein 1
MIKGIRRSLKGEKRTSPSITSPTTSTIAPKTGTPPKKIIRAIYDYASQGPGELSFKKGDFLYVTGSEDSEEWYEAYDPPSNARGMVPVLYFEVVSRKDSASTVSLSAAVSSVTPTSTAGNGHVKTLPLSNSKQHHIPQAAHKPPQLQIYGVVLYDFIAERSDELQAKAGESIIIIAKSNNEWFVAKPIGRLGGPGLIPISFIEVRNISTNQPVDNLEEAIRQAEVPRVEEWKRLAAEYKASSIPLGKLEDNTAGKVNPSVTEQLQNLNLGGGAYAIKQSSAHYQQDTASLQRPHQQHPHHHQQPQQQQQQQKELQIQQQYQQDNQQFQDYELEPYVVSASVDRYAFDNDRYWYLVVAKLSNGKYRNLCRYYQDFYDFQITLLDEFPDDAGRTGKKRTLPFMPGPLTYVNDSISSQRRVNLNDYVHNLTLLPEYIARSATVQRLFALRAGDVETLDPSTAMPHPPSRGSYISGTDVAPADDSQYYDQYEQQRGQSSQGYYQDQRQSAELSHASQQYVNLANGAPESPLSQDSQRTSHSNTVHSDNTTVLESINNEGSATDILDTMDGMPEALKGDKYVKIKVFHGDDLIAIKVPSNIAFKSLVDRVADRLALQHVVLLYKDEATGAVAELRNEHDFLSALGNREKLVLLAQ